MTRNTLKRNMHYSLTELVGARSEIERIVRAKTNVDEEDAREAVANSIAKLAVREYPQYPVAWLVKSSINAALDVVRHRSTMLVQHRLYRDLIDDLDELDPERQVEAEEQAALVEKIVAELPARTRHVLLRHAIDGVTPTAVCHEIGVCERTARNCLVEALTYCVSRLEHENQKKHLPVLRHRKQRKRRLRWNLELNNWVLRS